MMKKDFLVPLVNALLVSLLMTAVVSLVTTFLNLKAFDVHRWVGAWGLSWLIAFPTLMLVLPIVRKTVARCCQRAG